MQAVKLKMYLGLHIAAKNDHVSLMVRGLLAVSHTRGLKKKVRKEKTNIKMEKHWKQKKVSAKWRALIEKDVCIPAVISLCVYLLLCNTHTHSALCLFRECRTRQNLHTSPRWLEHTQYTRVEPVRQHLLVLHQKHDRVLSWGSFIILLHPWIYGYLCV